MRYKMATDLSICNSALIKLGANIITSLDQNSKEAILCKAQYPIVLARALQAHPWNFAIKRVTLQKMVTNPHPAWVSGATYMTGNSVTYTNPDMVERVYEALLDHSSLTFNPLQWKVLPIDVVAILPSFGYSSQFQLPPDYLRVLEPFPSTVTYVVEGDRILCDESTLSIKYIYNATDPSKYPPQFAEVVAYELAKELCYALVQSTTQQQIIIGNADRFLASARTYDAQEGTPPDFFRDEWDVARY